MIKSSFFYKLTGLIIINILTCAFIFYLIPYFFPSITITKQNLAYMAPTIFILSSLIISSIDNHSLWKVAKNIIIWQCIILFFVIIYNFRYDIQYSAIRVAASLFPSYGFSYNAQELVIARSIDGHFYINSYINGQPIKFMFDTGASSISLTKQDAEKLNYDSSTLNFNIPVSTANGISLSAPITLKEVKIGNFIFNDIDATVMKGDNDISLLGMALIAKFRNFRLEKDLLILSY